MIEIKELMFSTFNSQLAILDNSNEEGADCIYDLNEEIKDSSLKVNLIDY